MSEFEEVEIWEVIIADSVNGELQCEYNPTVVLNEMMRFWDTNAVNIEPDFKSIEEYMPPNYDATAHGATLVAQRLLFVAAVEFHLEKSLRERLGTAIVGLSKEVLGLALNQIGFPISNPEVLASAKIEEKQNTKRLKARISKEPEAIDFLKKLIEKGRELDERGELTEANLEIAMRYKPNDGRILRERFSVYGLKWDRVEELIKSYRM